MGNPNHTHKGLGNLGVGTTYLRDGRNPVEGIQFIYHKPRGVLRKNGIWDFGEKINFERFNMVELIKDKNSTLYNFGPLLVKKCKKLRRKDKFITGK